MEKFSNDKKSSKEDMRKKEVLGIEMDILDKIPFEKIKNLFGNETYLIGGTVRDVILDKNHLGDLDLMTRISKKEIREALENNGYKMSLDEKFSNNQYSVKDDVGVYNFLIDGKEVQVASILNSPVNDLIQSSDINMNCGAFSIGKRKIVTPEFIEEIKNKELRFIKIDEEFNPMKILSALKQISRTPDIKIEDETLEKIKSSTSDFIEYFKNNKNKIHKVKQILGNINSLEILEFFNNKEREFLLEIDTKRDNVNKSDKYFLNGAEELDEKTKKEISNLIRKKMGDKFKEHKLFNDRLNQIVYDLDGDGKVKSTCLFEGNRIYCASAEKTYDVYKLVSDLNKENGGLWTTINNNNESLIYLANKAGMKLVDNPEVMRKIILNQYPQYKDDLVIEKQGEHLVYYKESTKYLKWF